MSTMRTPEASRCSVSQSVVTRGSKCSIALLLEEVVFAGVGLGELAGLLLVVLAEATLYDLVPEVVFEDLDPTSRPAPELPHEVVAIQRALEPLYGVLGPDLTHPFLEAAPGLLGDAPPPRGAPGDVRPGELQEHVHVDERPVATREVRVPDKAPDRGVAPRVAARGVPVRAHVVGDEVGYGVYVILRVGKPAHRPARYGGPDVLVAVEVDLPRHGPAAAALALPLLGGLVQALRATVRAAVLVDEGARLANVVEKGGLAKDGEPPLAHAGFTLDARDHYQGVLEDVLVVELGLLLDVHRLHELRHDVAHEVEAHQGPQTPGYVLRAEDLLELVPDTLGAYAFEPVRVLLDGALEVGRHGEGLLGGAQSRLEAYRPQHPQGVVAHPVQRVPDGTDHTPLQVFAPLEGVEDLTGQSIRRYGVYREVPASQVFLQTIPESHFGVPATLRIKVAAVRRDVYLDAVYLRDDRAEPLPHRPQVLRVGSQDTFDLPRPGVRRRVGMRLRVLSAEKRIPHVPADQIQLVPRLPERLAQALQGIGQVQLFNVCHHHSRDSSTRAHRVQRGGAA